MAEAGPEPEALEELVRAACERADYQAAATVLLEAIGPKVFAFLLHRLGNPLEASEAFSAFGEDLWCGLPGFEWRCTVRGWSFAIARHAADRHTKRARAQRRRNVPLSQAPLSGLVHEVRERTLMHLRTEAKTKLQELLNRLPADDRALLQLRLDQRLSWRDLALALDYDGDLPSEEALARSAAKLRKRFQLLKQRLRQRVEHADS